MEKEITGRAPNVGYLFQWKGIAAGGEKHLDECIAFCPSAFMLAYDADRYGANPGGRGVCFEIASISDNPRDKKVAVCRVGDYIYKNPSGGFHLMTKEEVEGK